jgi:hypothetical protein
MGFVVTISFFFGASNEQVKLLNRYRLTIVVLWISNRFEGPISCDQRLLTSATTPSARRARVCPQKKKNQEDCDGIPAKRIQQAWLTFLHEVLPVDTSQADQEKYRIVFFRRA